jgi:sodium/potassium-transporting ATPase subunit alpha
MDASQLHQDVHRIDLDNLFQRFHSNQRTGLTSALVSDARAHYGRNCILPPGPPNYFWLLAKQSLVGFNAFLWLAGVLAIVAYKPLGADTPSMTNLGLGIVIFLVIICNAILNVYQKMKSIKLVASFPKLLPTVARVRRDGIEQQIAAEEIVPGDIILVRVGDKLPADCRFLTCNALKVNRAASFTSNVSVWSILLD